MTPSTTHYNTRKHRTQLQPIGTPIKAVVVDNNHPNGKEIHTIYDSGMVAIQNANTKRLVTVIWARPQQLKRYFKHVPTKLWNVATKNKERGLNLL